MWGIADTKTQITEAGNTMPVVNIQMFEGRESAKAEIAKTVTESIAKNAGIDPKYVYVLFSDVKTSDWAISGELFSETMKKSN